MGICWANTLWSNHDTTFACAAVLDACDTICQYMRTHMQWGHVMTKKSNFNRFLFMYLECNKAAFLNKIEALINIGFFILTKDLKKEIILQRFL